MTERLELSRRKALAALGTIGVASAGAGLGTSAYFSDQETFENNRLTAGTLDMVVDWEEHYSDWMGEEEQYARMPVGDEEADFVLEAPENSEAKDIELIFPEDGDKQRFWDATAIEAYPDADNDALQDPVEVPCDDLGSLDDVLSSDDRTDNEWTNPGDPLISLQDVKPGDFGEVTLSFHLCENPGFVWFGGDLITNADGENTEPEIDDPDEPQGGPGEDPITETSPGELADQIQVRAWYDDCDNMYEPDTPAACVYHLFDNSGTMEQNLAQDEGTADKAEMAARIGTGVTEYLDQLDGNGNGTLTDAPTGVGYMGGDDGTTEEPFPPSSTDEATIDAAINGQVGDSAQGGITAQDIVAGLNDAADALGACENDNKVLIMYANGDTRPGDEADRQSIYTAAANAKAAGITIKVVGFDVDEESSDEDFLETVGDELYLVPESPTATEVEDDADAVQADIEQQFDAVTDGEEEIFQGPLTEFINSAPFDPENGDLGHALEGDLPAGDGGGMGRNCFTATRTHCIGFEWWLPLDHGNEVQGDIVEFDLGFYTEQCRHNDGAGMNAEPVDGNSNPV
jgi:predicted ribosomally synthesized peptide with SipW-like signal peptide